MKGTGLFGVKLAYTILGITFLIYIQLLIIAGFLGIDSNIPLRTTEAKSARYLKLLLLMSPVFFLLYFGVKEKKMEELGDRLGYEHFDKEVNHRTLLFLYLFLSFAALMFLAVIRK